MTRKRSVSIQRLGIKIYQFCKHFMHNFTILCKGDLIKMLVLGVYI